MSTAITPFEPTTVNEGLALAETLAKSSLLPNSLRGKPADVLVVLATARELGIGPMQGLSDINVIQGKPVFSADLMVAQCKRRPDVCKYIRLVESTEERATYETQRAGSPEPERFTFTMADAEALGLKGKDNWRKQPKTMLRRRAAAALAREVYPDLVRGYDPDEAEDFARRPVQAAPAVVEPPKDETQRKAEALAAQVIEQSPVSGYGATALDVWVDRVRTARDFDELDNVKAEIAKAKEALSPADIEALRDEVKVRWHAIDEARAA